MARTTTEVIQSHLMKRLEGDLEGDIQENFSPDVLIRLMACLGDMTESASLLASSLMILVRRSLRITTRRSKVTTPCLNGQLEMGSAPCAMAPIRSW